MLAPAEWRLLGIANWDKRKNEEKFPEPKIPNPKGPAVKNLDKDIKGLKEKIKEKESMAPGQLPAAGLLSNTAQPPVRQQIPIAERLGGFGIPNPTFRSQTPYIPHHNPPLQHHNYPNPFIQHHNPPPFHNQQNYPP